MPKFPKITSLHYLANDMLDHLDFRYVHRPPNDNFYLKQEERDQGSVIMFSCSEVF